MERPREVQISRQLKVFSDVKLPLIRATQEEEVLPKTCHSGGAVSYGSEEQRGLEIDNLGSSLSGCTD